MNRHVRVYLTVFVAILVLVCTRVFARTLEITQVDLFSLKGWKSTQVTVDGLRLGMSLKEANAGLSAYGLNLYDQGDQKACLVTSRFCYASREPTHDGTIIGVELGPRSEIVAIVLEIPENPATLPATLAARFKGMTRRFFFHYSDALRLKLLGPPDRVKKSPTTDAMQGQIYYYDRLGLIVGTSRSLMRGMKAPTPPELSDIEFVMPKPVPQKKPGHE